MKKTIDCPSAQPEMKSSRIYGVMTGPSDNLRAGYLTETVAPTAEMLALSGEAAPTQLFRIAAPCMNHGCRHFDGSCKLAQRIVATLPAVVNALPDCRIRETCRWFLQEGADACLRCPQVATDQVPVSAQDIWIANGD